MLPFTGNSKENIPDIKNLNEISNPNSGVYNYWLKMRLTHIANLF